MKKLFLALLFPALVFAQDNINIGTVVGQGKYLGGKTADGQTTVPMIGIDASGDTAVNALSGKTVSLKVNETDVATFSTTGSTIPPLLTTSETVAGAGTTVADAAQLAGGTTYVHRITGANGTVGWKFATSTPIGSVQILLNTTAGVAKIYGESGSTVNGGSADAAFTALTGIKPIICIKTAALTYLCA